MMTINIDLHVSAGLHFLHSAVADTVGWQRLPTHVQTAGDSGRGSSHQQLRWWRGASGPEPMLVSQAASSLRNAVERRKPPPPPGAAVVPLMYLGHAMLSMRNGTTRNIS